MGNAVAMYNLGVNYFYGQGVVENKAQAGHWYRKSAEAGDPDAKRVLETLSFGVLESRRE
jgi:TPR repeat protein